MILEIQKEIRKLGSCEKAIGVARFFKTAPGEYAEGDKFLGVMVPVTRKLVKKYADLSLADLEILLKSQFHEERLLALLIMVGQYKAGKVEQQKKIFQLFWKNKEQVNNWDLVDLSTDHIVGAYLSDKDKTPLSKLAVSKNLWERRIAMLATFHDIKKGDSKIALQIAEKLLVDEHDLIHKAVGWMLREVGKRCALEEEEKFLKKYADRMPRTMLRYAIERFPEQKRKSYLAIKKINHKK